MIEDYFRRDDVHLEEVRGDLLSVGCDFMVAHCISRDCALGKGIARDIDQAFGVRRALLGTGFNYGKSLVGIVEVPVVDGPYKGVMMIANIVTKAHFWEKPTYESMRAGLGELRGLMEKMHVVRLAVPRIGCGLDGMDWKEVKKIILDTFKGSRMVIRVYYL